MYLSDNDRHTIEQLAYNPELEPSFDVIKSCLIWDDERPDGVSSQGYELICDLWIIRSFIHRDIPKEDWGLDPEYFLKRWAMIKDLDLKWPGFKRMELSEAESRFYEKKLKELSNISEY